MKKLVTRFAFICLGLVFAGLFSPLYAADKFYSLWVASFETEKKAAEQVAMYKKQEFDAFYREESLGKSGIRYRVYVGRYESKAEIDTGVKTLTTKKLLPKKYFVRALPDAMAQASARQSGKATAETFPRGPGKVEVPAVTRKASMAEENQILAGRQPSKDQVQTVVIMAEPPTSRPRDITRFTTSAALSPVSGVQEKTTSTAEKRTSPALPVVREPDLIRDPVKDWAITAAYGIWYMDMSRKYANTGLNSKAFLHGPMFRASWRKLELELKYLDTMGDFSSTGNDQFANGTQFTKREAFKRTDYEGALKYWFHTPSRSFSVAPVIGYKHTRLQDMSTAVTLTNGQEFTVTGKMNIFGPTFGAEVAIPFGNVDRPPVVLNLAAMAMYLRASGNHPQFLPPTGAQFGSSVTGAEFSTWGWGGSGDAHLIFRITDGLQLKVGGSLQSARLFDKAPDGTDMWISNGFIGSYIYMLYTW